MTDLPCEVENRDTGWEEEEETKESERKYTAWERQPHTGNLTFISFWPSIIISLGLNKRGKPKSLFPITVFTHLKAKHYFILRSISKS